MGEFDTLIEKSWGYNQKHYTTDSRWNILKDLYVLNYMHDIGRDYTVLPKKIHQIWLGGSLPDEYKKWTESWKVFNPDWEYKLWTDDDVKDINISKSKVYNSIRNVGQRSDYLRYHILKQYGGLYVDTDFECLKSFDDLTHCNFLTGIGYPSTIELYIGLIACVPDHPIINRMIYGMNKSNNLKDIFNSTGTYLFTKVFFEEIKGWAKGVLALPTDYFYPFPNHKGHHLEDGRKYIQECSYAIHHWEVSWSKEKQAKFKNNVSK